MLKEFEKYLHRITKATSCKELEIVQSLWSGYGKISRYKLDDSENRTVVVKNILLKKNTEHPRGWNTNAGHNRKVKSYEVETQWYEKWSMHCGEKSKVPKFIGSFKKGQEQWIVMEDLNENFPVRKTQPSMEEIKVCLKWLANFHATFLNIKPDGLWETGTYWYLSTRSDEFEKTKNQEVKEKAYLIDRKLNECKFKTIVHGDAKLANFCFSVDGTKVAAVDFQYVGGGCGMKDVAYFLGSCLSGHELEQYAPEFLDFYFTKLKKAINESCKEIDCNQLEKEWREMYPFACADFTRFLTGWMPEHEKINNYQLDILQKVLANL